MENKYNSEKAKEYRKSLDALYSEYEELQYRAYVNLHARERLQKEYMDYLDWKIEEKKLPVGVPLGSAPVLNEESADVKES